MSIRIALWGLHTFVSQLEEWVYLVYCIGWTVVDCLSSSSIEIKSSFEQFSYLT